MSPVSPPAPRLDWVTLPNRGEFPDASRTASRWFEISAPVPDGPPPPSAAGQERRAERRHHQVSRSHGILLSIFCPGRWRGQRRGSVVGLTGPMQWHGARRSRPSPQRNPAMGTTLTETHGSALNGGETFADRTPEGGPKPAFSQLCASLRTRTPVRATRC